jgi:nitrite reductase/ring-hydroxylating ferredoxin subunit
VLVEVATLADLKEGVGDVVRANGREIMIVRWRGAVYAIRNICPHMAAPFSGANRAVERGGSAVHARVCGGGELGELVQTEEAVITCPWHTWTFRLRDGSCIVDPALRVKAYEVVVEGGTVYLEMGGERKAAAGAPGWRAPETAP